MTKRAREKVATILELREKVRGFVSEYDVFIRIVLKFLLTFISLRTVVGFLGQSITGNVMIGFVVAGLICAALPAAVSPAVCGAGAVVVLLARLPQFAGVLGVVLLIMILVYYAYIPDNAVVSQITLILAILGLPYLAPVCVGLYKKPHASIGVGFGMVLYYLTVSMKSIMLSVSTMTDSEDADVIGMLTTQLGQNREIVFAVLLAVFVVVVVYAVRNIAIDYAWQMAVGIGILVTLLAYLVADYTLELYKSMAGIFGGCAIAAVVAFFIGFMSFHLDYSRTEYVQFEDEEYKYYVKAVPKVTVSTKEKTLQSINETDAEE